MKNHHECWSFAAIRGVLDLLAAVTFAAMPDAVRRQRSVFDFPQPL